MAENPVTIHDRDSARVQLLSKWYSRAVLSNGQPCPLPEGELTVLLAEATLNFLDHRKVWSPEIHEWVPVSATVDLADVDVEQLDPRAVRMTHLPTGLVALEETHDAAFAVLKRKVKEATDA